MCLMPHISRQKVDDKILNTLFTNLSKSLAKIKNQKDSSYFLNEILTRTERIMIGKRMTVIWLLHKEVSVSKIENGLKMSRSTIYRISINYEQGKYKNIIKILEKREIDFFGEMYNILHLGGLLKPYGVNWKKVGKNK